MIRARSDAERELDRLQVCEPEEWQARLRLYYALLGGGASDTGDALERAERGEEPHGNDLDDPLAQAEFPFALRDVRAERFRRDRQRDAALRRAAGLLAVARARAQAEGIVA